MNRRFFGLAVALAAILSGCCGRPGGCLVNNIGGTRIAAPATGSIQYPRLAAVDPYYNTSQPTAGGNAVNGWRAAGAPAVPLPTQPSGAQAVPRSTPLPAIPAGNSTFASSSSVLQPGGNLQVAQSTTGIAPGVSPAAGNTAGLIASGGMPLNDATQSFPQDNRVASSGGIFNRTWEYVVRPTVVPSTVPSQQTAWPNGPNPNLVIAGNTTGNVAAPGLSYTAAPWNAGYGYGYPQGVIADGWRQRDAATGISR